MHKTSRPSTKPAHLLALLLLLVSPQPLLRAEPTLEAQVQIHRTAWDGEAVRTSTSPIEAASGRRNPRRLLLQRGAPVDDTSLKDVNAKVLSLRDAVWAGNLAPSAFYPVVQAVFKDAFGPDYEDKIRAFLRDRTTGPPPPGPDLDFARMSPEDFEAFFQEMPKGADLHLHLTGSAEPDLLMDLAEKGNVELSSPAIRTILTSVGLDPAGAGIDLSRARLPLREMPLPVKQAMKKFLLANEFDRTFADFQRKWALISPITADREATTYPLLRSLALSAKAQGILYLEVMTDARPQTLRAATAAAERLESETGVVLRIMASGLWELPTAATRSGIEETGKWMDRGVVGFNMVSDELQGPLKNYDSFRELRETLPRLAVALHAGERPGSSENIVDDLLLGVERYGHATQVEENAIAMAVLYTNKIPVEVSLISNEKTGVITDLRRHPLPRLLRWKVPVILSTDDPGIFGSDLSKEYALAQRQFSLSWPQLKQISRDGIRNSFLDERTKERLLGELERRLTDYENSPRFRRYSR